MPSAVPGVEVPGRPASPAPALGQVGVDLDVADQLLAQGAGQAGAVDPDRPAHLQAGHGRLGGSRQLVDPGQQHDLGVAVVDEPGPLVQGADVRPLLGEAVHAGRGQRAVGRPSRHLPAPQLVQAGRHEGVGRGCRVRPGARLRPVQQPVDLPGASVLRSATQGSTIHSPGSRSSWLMTVLTGTETPGTTAWTWALTRAVSCSRSGRRKGPTWTSDMEDLHRRRRRWRVELEAATGAVRRRQYQAGAPGSAVETLTSSPP
jgi:hypothetical protein